MAVGHLIRRLGEKKQNCCKGVEPRRGRTGRSRAEPGGRERMDGDGMGWGRGRRGPGRRAGVGAPIPHQNQQLVMLMIYDQQNPLFYNTNTTFWGGG